MESIKEPKKKTIQPSLSIVEQLRTELEKSKKSNETIIIKPVSTSNFRVNWLIPDIGGKDIVIITYRIAKSKFLQVTNDNGKLVIIDKTL